MSLCQSECRRFESDYPLHNKEGWLRGLRQQIANLSSGVTCSEGSNPSPSTKYYSEIAQSVERRTVNPQVPGSSPGFGAK